MAREGQTKWWSQPFRFSVRTLLVFTLVCGAAIGVYFQPVDQWVSVHGRVENPSAVAIRCRVKNRTGYAGPSTLIANVIPEGTHVKQGDWLITFESRGLEDDLRKQKIIVTASKALLTQSRAVYDAAVISSPSHLNAARVEVENSKARYKEEETKLSEIEEQLQECVVTAPRAGQVLYANVSSPRSGGRVVIKPGTPVRERQIIIRLIEPNSMMQVRAKIDEAHAKKVKVGALAWIRIDGFGDEEYEGKVTDVTNVKDIYPPHFWPSTETYVVLIKIVDPPPACFGLDANMRIRVRVVDD